MQKIISVLSFFVLFALLSTSVFAQTTTAGSKSGSDIQKSIQDRLNSYANALVNNDYATLESFYTDDAISMPNYGKMLNGKNAIHNDNKQSSKSGMKINSLDLNVTKVLNEKGELVDAIGNFTISMTGKDNKMMKDEGNFLCVLEKQKGEWKIKAEIWNTTNNPWMKKSDKMGDDKMNNMKMDNDADKDTSGH